MSLVKVQRRKVFVIVLALLIIAVCYVSRTNSVDVSSLNLNNISGLFDPRPEEIDQDLLNAAEDSEELKEKLNLAEKTAPKGGQEDEKELTNVKNDKEMGKSKDSKDKSKENAGKGKESKEKGADKGKVGDPMNPKEYLGDITEMDKFEEKPKTNFDDKDMEKDRAQRTTANTELELDDETGEFVEIEPVTVPEEPYPEIPALDRSLLAKALDFRIYTHNIKNGKHGELVPGEFDWDERRDDVASSILLHRAPNTIIVLQEALDFQLDFIVDRLNLLVEDPDTKWVAVGGGRIDGKKEGEHVPIIVRQNEWEVVYTDTFWLNDQKTRTAVAGWDAKYPRICTFATLKSKESGAYVNVFNTHFDHKGKLAKIELAKLLIEKMRTVNEWPSILTGDLNSMPDDKTYKTLSKLLIDSRKLTASYNRYGHREVTVTGFQGAQGQKGQRIDYIFVPAMTTSVAKKRCTGQAGPVYLQLQDYGLLHSKYGGKYMSDHRPILVDFQLGAC